MKRFLWLIPSLIFLAGCTHQIETGLPEHEAQDIVVTLREHGIDASAEADPLAKKDSAAWHVSVLGTRQDVVAAWKILRENGLPHEKLPGLEELFSTPGMIPTAGEEKARMLLAMVGELGRTLRSMPGVVDARVHVVLPDNTSLLDKKDQNATTASVLVRYRSDRPPLTDDEIKGLVAKGVEGLSAENVNVVQKRMPDRPLPPQMMGPLDKGEWITIGALALCGITSLGALSSLFVSKRRALRIKELEGRLQLVGS
jgi:type III secretion protein J